MRVLPHEDSIGCGNSNSGGFAMTHRLRLCATVLLAGLLLAASFLTPANASKATCDAMDNLISAQEGIKKSALDELRGFLRGFAAYYAVSGLDDPDSDTVLNPVGTFANGRAPGR